MSFSVKLPNGARFTSCPPAIAEGAEFSDFDGAHKAWMTHRGHAIEKQEYKRKKYQKKRFRGPDGYFIKAAPPDGTPNKPSEG